MKFCLYAVACPLNCSAVFQPRRGAMHHRQLPDSSLKRKDAIARPGEGCFHPPRTATLQPRGSMLPRERQRLRTFILESISALPELSACWSTPAFSSQGKLITTARWWLCRRTKVTGIRLRYAPISPKGLPKLWPITSQSKARCGASRVARCASLVANFNIDVALDRYGVATRIVDQEVPYTYLSATLLEAIIAFCWLAN